MEKHSLSNNSDGTPSTKIRRIARACLQCRARKQRCLPSSETAALRTPCRRCSHHAIACSFENEELPPAPVSSEQDAIIAHLDQQINLHEHRIAELERQIRLSQIEPRELHSSRQSQRQPSALGDQGNHRSTALFESNVPVARSPEFSMDGLDLGPPIATLRSLGAMSKAQTISNASPDERSRRQITNTNGRHASHDPVSRGILSLSDAYQAINIFFDHCHPMAPVLSEGLRGKAVELRKSSPTLFLAICYIGARFWNESGLESDSVLGLHPRFFDLAALLDLAVSHLLLRPIPSDVTLDSIRVLLLYAQWMPCSQSGEENNEDSELTESARLPTNRYNDISAWAMLGLAARYAVILGLDRTAILPFEGPQERVSEEDISRLRVWYNLLTCDWNLMLSSALPATLDPAGAASVSRAFGCHRIAQQPNDLRYSALIELAMISHRTLGTKREFSARRLDATGLRKVNIALQDWERHWTPRLRYTSFQHIHLPFTSLRWCRLALNSAAFGPFLSPTNKHNAQPLKVWALEALETSLTAAAGTIFCVSTSAIDLIWSLDSQNVSTFPDGPFVVDHATLKRLSYTVDSTWVSHTFAVTFLVFCYIKGVIDDDLQICSLIQTDSLQHRAPLLPRSASVVSRLLRLALDLFDEVCQIATFRLARDFQAIVNNAASLLLIEDQGNAIYGHEVDSTAMQSLLDQMIDSGLDWPGSALDPWTGEADWSMDGTLGI